MHEYLAGEKRHKQKPLEHVGDCPGQLQRDLRGLAADVEQRHEERRGGDSRGMQATLNRAFPGEFPEVPEGGAVWVFGLE